MPAGKLKWWSAGRGFGFIAQDAGGPDMFLHFSDLSAAGIDPQGIKIGDRLSSRAAEIQVRKAIDKALGPKRAIRYSAP
jgi:cold shock CspA family protein